MVNQASRQVAAADGDPVVWYHAEEKAARATERLLDKNDIEGITVKVVPQEEK